METFLLGLLIVSTLTSLTTEGVKKLLDERKVVYSTNALAGIVAAVLSLCIGIGYVMLSEVGFTQQIIVYLIALVFLSWLCAMVGYDKVVQSIAQLKKR